MPSEMIYGTGGIDVRVAWGANPEGQVQIATLKMPTDDDPVDQVIGLVNGWLKDAGMAEINGETLRGLLPYAPVFGGWHASLTNWAEINKLIRVLKRARDRQFGDPA